MDALAHWRDLRLIQIVAPSGYGKTTLATTWIHAMATLPAAERPAIAWISLIEDLDADHLLRLWIEALAPHVPSVRDLSNYDGTAEFATPQRIRLFCDQIAAAATPIVLVIDDYHLVHDHAVHAVTQQVLDLAPAPLHLILLSRTTPPLQLDQLILDDAVLPLAESDLRLDHAEFAVFADAFDIAHLPTAMLAEVESVCAGWVTGLKLLAYDLQHDRVHSPLSVHASSDHFFLHRVLPSLPIDQQAILESTAPLPYLTAELLATVSARPVHECAGILREIAAANAFVTVYASHSGDARSYRLHPLFRSFLQRRHAHRENLEPLGRAVVWLLEHDADAAMTLLHEQFDGGRRASAAVLDALAAAVRRAMLRFDRISMQRWLHAIPDEIIAAHAPLAVAAGWHAWFFDMRDEQRMHTIWQRAADAVAALPSSAAHDELRAEAMLLQAMRCLVLDKGDGALQAIEAAERAPHAPNGLAAAYIPMLRSVFFDADDDIDARLQRIQIASDICERIGFGHGVIEMMVAQVMLHCSNCSFEDAQATAGHLLAVVARAHWHYSTYVPHIHYIRGEMYYLTNQIAAARKFLQQAIDASRAVDDAPSVTLYMAETLLQLCDAAQHPQDSLDFDFDVDADASAWADITHGRHAINVAMAAWPRLLRDFRAGRLSACSQTAECLRITVADLDERTNDRVRLAVLAGAVFSGRTDDVVRTKLRELRADLTRARFDLMRIQVLALQTLDARQRGDATTHASLFAELLPEIERTGMMRLLLDLPGQFALAPNLIDNQQLTLQESRILKKLADDHSPKEIAKLLHLSVGTVRVHIRSIYRKLQVHSRHEAVAKARAAGLLPADQPFSAR
jgi:LuxR family maltose regulon positive regulatory protein